MKKEFLWPVAVIALIVALVVGSHFLAQDVRIPPASDNASGPSDTSYQRIGTGAVIEIDFGEEMDTESVEERLELPETLSGSLSWKDESTLVIESNAPLVLGESFEVVVGPGAQSKIGIPFPTKKTFYFSVSGSPEIIERLPVPGSTDVPSNATLTMIFDRPVVPLTTVGQRVNMTEETDFPISIDPPVDGRWRFVSTTTLEFQPGDNLDLATHYTVTVPAGIPTKTGGSTTDDYSWHFETKRPKVLSTNPSSSVNNAGPGTQMSVQFSQSMNLDSAGEHIFLVRGTRDRNAARQFLGLADGGTSQTELSVVPIRLSYGTQKVWHKNQSEKEDKSVVVLKPETPLALDDAYTIVVTEGIMGLQGNIGSAEGRSVGFGTAGPFTVTSGEKRYSRIRIQFSNPIEDLDTLKEHITIDPPIENWDDIVISPYSYSSSSQVSFYPRLKPSTHYTVTIETGPKDIHGQPLTSQYSFTFKTDPLDPNLFIHSRGVFGIFERDKPPVYYINSVNIPKYTVELAPMTFPEFMTAMEGRNNYKTREQAQDLLKYEGYTSWEVVPGAASDEWKSEEVDLRQKFGSDLKPGIYGLAVRSPAFVYNYGERKPRVARQYFAVTNMAMTLKYTGREALVWVTDMRTGDPVEGAKIGFHNYEGPVFVEAQTDADGFATVGLPWDAVGNKERNYWRGNFWVSVRKGDDIAFMKHDWNSGIRPYNFDLSEGFAGTDHPYQLDAYVYTDRPVYRTGHDVHFKGILRLRDRKTGVLYVPRDGREVRISIRNSRGDTIYEKTSPLTEFGSVSGTVPIDDDAPLGTYRVSMFLNSDDITNNNTGTSFKVQEYRKPEYRVDLNFENDTAYDGDLLRATVDASYYFGGPMEGAAVSWRAVSQDYFFNKFSGGWYRFALEQRWCWYGCEPERKVLAEGKGTLDERGQFFIDLPISLEDKGISQTVTIDAEITDLNNQVVSSSASIPVHVSGVYVGVKNDTYSVRPGDDAVIKVVTVDPDGEPIARQPVTLKLYSRTWTTVRKRGVDGGYYYENDVKDTFISEKTIRTNGDGKEDAKITIPSGGSFRVVATVTDEVGRENSAATTVYAWSSTYFNWPRSNNDRIEVIADRPEYSVGDRAKLLVKSPYQGKGVKALVTVEREGIINKGVIEIEGNAQPIEIPVTQDMVPNAYVSVVIMKARQGETFNEHGLDTGTPAFKVGYAEINVDTSARELQIDLQTDKKKYAPQETVTVDLSTTDASGNPQQAEVSLAVVDMSVLALTGYELPDLLQRFYRDRGVGVRTSQMLVYMLERFKPGSKGGGGGGPVDIPIRGEFKDTAFWKANVVTNAQGKATVSVPLPDNLTTWKIIAIGHTKKQTFGAEAVEIVETKPVILRPVRPRFAVQGDELQLGAIVHNFTEKKRTFTVSLEGSGFTYAGKKEWKVTVQPDEKHKVLFPITIDHVEEATFRMQARVDDIGDAIEETIPVYVFGVPQFVATSGKVSEEPVTEHIYVPDEDEVGNLEIEARMAPTLATSLPSGLEYLVRFPYGCAEQTVSSFLPNIAVKQLEGFEVFDVTSDEELERNIIGGLERIATYQRSDGGFGYFAGDDESNVYLSAYIVYALHQTQDAGYNVDADMLRRGEKYLQKVLPHLSSHDGRYGRPINLSQKAFILYVLSEMGSHDPGRLSSLYEERSSLSLFSQAQLAMALQNAGDGASKRRAKTIMGDILAQAKVDARGIRLEENDRLYWRPLMSTNTRTTAIVLQALLRIDPEHPFAPRMVEHLLSIKHRGYWGTTQATTYSIFALVDYLQYTNELNADFDANVSLNGDGIASHSFDSQNILTEFEIELGIRDLLEARDNAITFNRDGVGRLYYDLSMQYFLKRDTIEPREEGIGILREIEPVDEQNPDVTVGSTHRVTLTITVPQDRYYVAVESPHLAGFEAIDLSLKTSQQRLKDLVNEMPTNWRDYWRSSARRFNHKEFRDDRVFLFADRLPKGVYKYEYLVRATTPGTFRQRPARAWEMYFPEIFGQTGGSWYEIN